MHEQGRLGITQKQHTNQASKLAATRAMAAGELRPTLDAEAAAEPAVRVRVYGAHLDDPLQGSRRLLPLWRQRFAVPYAAQQSTASVSLISGCVVAVCVQQQHSFSIAPAQGASLTA